MKRMHGSSSTEPLVGDLAPTVELSDVVNSARLNAGWLTKAVAVDPNFGGFYGGHWNGVPLGMVAPHDEVVIDHQLVLEGVRGCTEIYESQAATGPGVRCSTCN